jgi:GH43 family beta-xylosidase
MIKLNRLIKFFSLLFFILIFSYPSKQLAQNFSINNNLSDPLQIDKQLNKTIAGKRIKDTVVKYTCKFTNPVMKPESPDPYVCFKDGYYYFCVTTGNDVTIHKSDRLENVAQALGIIVWRTDLNIKSDIWAPEIHYLNGKWYIYASGNPKGGLNLSPQYMFVLEGNTQDAQGSYTYKGIYYDQPAIDGTVWQDSSNRKIYSSFSRFDPLIGNKQCIYIAPMETPTKMGYPRVRLSIPEYDWEQKDNQGNFTRPVQEGPAFLKYGSKLHITYSASGCESIYYCLGLLTCSNGNYLDPKSWTKSPNPVFQKSEVNKVWGPGHNGFVETPHGEYWLIYHAKTGKKATNSDRCTRMQRFKFDADDYPVFDEPLKAGVPVTCPN